MWKIRSFGSQFLLLCCSIITVSSLGFAKSNQERTIPSLLSELGYQYREAGEGRWRVAELPNDGLNFKTLDFFFETNSTNQSLKISVHLGRLITPAETPVFKERLANLNEQYKPTKFIILEASFFLMAEVPAQNLDKKSLEQAIEKLARQANKTYPDVARFIEVRKESLGMGGGVGAGSGSGFDPNNSVYHPPESSQSTTTSTVDSKPVILSHVRPEYTEEARNNQVRGEVIVRVLVGADGEVKTARIVKGLPDGLNEKAIDAARKTKFKPAMKDGKPVPYMATLSINFNIY